MPTLDQLRESIEGRISELRNEIASLEAARAALHRERVIRTTVATSTNGAGKPTRRRKAASDGHGADASSKTRNGAGARAPATAANDAPTKPAAAAPESRRRSPRKSSNSGKPVEVLLAGKLEAMLSEAEDGLSAVAISERSNAGYDQVLAVLRHLQSGGQIRRTADESLAADLREERIAERAAELERLSVAKSGTSTDRR